ncbi:hypothetical protein ABH931_001429 [Streptacidiphilus sp. MAP12-33]|uniref:hypothetical protein n=1 Tax=Streptacidiphilus sp. MAP12-33 TaxID=3156266 RepID=UPI003513079D
MSVRVTVMPATIPHHLRNQEALRLIHYSDTEEAEYAFTILTSGALAVWRRRPGSDAAGELEIIHGPTTWDTVQGTADGELT